MASAAVVKLKPNTMPGRLECSACGATATAGCDCGAAYVPAGTRAAAAVAANPEKSDRAIAADIGVSHPTVAKARKATGKQLPVEKRTGRDGKERKMPKRKARPQARRVSRTPILDRAREIVRPLVKVDKTINARALAEEHDVSHATIETAVAVERALLNERTIDIETLPGRDREKLDIAIRQERRKLESEFDQRLRTELRAEFRSIMMKEFQDVPSDSDSDEQRWHMSLANLAAHAASLSAFWDREFGAAWRRSFRSTPQIITLSEQAAAIWREIADDLKRRSMT